MPPMLLDDMRRYGVRYLLVTCWTCKRDRDVNVDDQPGSATVKSFERRLVCRYCGGRDVHVRPAWHTSTIPGPRADYGHSQ